jgi:hypothetical protein
MYRENEKQVYSNLGPLFHLPERPELKLLAQKISFPSSDIN